MVNRDAYVVCVLEGLHRCLGRRDFYAKPSHRWAGPRGSLLDGDRWDPIDGTYQRRMNRQLTAQASRHHLARMICHGNRGQIRQPYREGQEDQLAALGLVVNAVVLWNTRYLDAILEQLRARPIRPR